MDFNPPRWINSSYSIRNLTYCAPKWPFANTKNTNYGRINDLDMCPNRGLNDDDSVFLIFLWVGQYWYETIHNINKFEKEQNVNLQWNSNSLVDF